MLSKPDKTCVIMLSKPGRTCVAMLDKPDRACLTMLSKPDSLPRLGDLVAFEGLLQLSFPSYPLLPICHCGKSYPPTYRLSLVIGSQ